MEVDSDPSADRRRRERRLRHFLRHERLTVAVSSWFIDRDSPCTHGPHQPPPPQSNAAQGKPQHQCVGLFSLSVSSSGLAMSDREPAGEGAARRRRERRLRQWARHEKLSVQMALYEYKHHSSRGQRKDRAGERPRTTRPRCGSASSPKGPDTPLPG